MTRALRASNEFFSKMEGFLESYLPRSYTEPSRRAKVCIIDTGIDLKHPSVQGAKKRLREMISFKGDSMEDETGHGTLVAELVLRLAPEATLCVAKVAVAKTMPEEDTQLITRVSSGIDPVKKNGRGRLIRCRPYIGQCCKTRISFHCLSPLIY